MDPVNSKTKKQARDESLAETIGGFEEQLTEISGTLKSITDWQRSPQFRQEPKDPMRIYNAAKTPPSWALQQVKGKGDRGFKPTAIDAQWRVEAITSVLGPAGINWGFRILGHWKDRFDLGTTPVECVYVHLQLWISEDATYCSGIDSGGIETIGGTKVVYSTYHDRQTGQTVTVPQNPDEAYKAAVTDALGKCLSMLGIAAAVYDKRFDGDKYVAEEGSSQHYRQPAPTKQETTVDLNKLKEAIANCDSLDSVEYLAQEIARSGPPANQHPVLRNIFNEARVRLGGTAKV